MSTMKGTPTRVITGFGVEISSGSIVEVLDFSSGWLVTDFEADEGVVLVNSVVDDC